MPHCLNLLSAVAALAVSSVVRVEANPLTLISCAGGYNQAILDTIQPGQVAAGVVMPNLAQAQRRADQVFATSVANMIATGDDIAIVVVGKGPVRVPRGDTTCVIFGGSPHVEPRPPTGWANTRN